MNREYWNFCQTMALLHLAGRSQDVRCQLPRILAMLEAEDQLTRVYGWDALRLVFDDEAKAIGDYNPRASLGECVARVSALKQELG